MVLEKIRTGLEGNDWAVGLTPGSSDIQATPNPFQTSLGAVLIRTGKESKCRYYIPKEKREMGCA